MQELATATARVLPDREPQASLWRPSEYTGLLIHALESESGRLVRGTVLEVGVGSGVVLAALAGLGARCLVGTDVEPAAVRETRSLLDRIGRTAELLVGDLWAPVGGRRFDLVVANPPALAATAASFGGRPPTWSYGGPDGRRVVDPFLRGLRRHLAEGGRAVLQHSAFLGLAKTAEILAEEGLSMRRLASSLMPVTPEKRAVMSPGVLERAEPGSLRRIGDHLFLAVDIVEIGAAGGFGGR